MSTTLPTPVSEETQQATCTAVQSRHRLQDRGVRATLEDRNPVIRSQGYVSRLLIKHTGTQAERSHHCRGCGRMPNAVTPPDVPRIHRFKHLEETLTHTAGADRFRFKTKGWIT